jgi:hypothetical protein
MLCFSITIVNSRRSVKIAMYGDNSVLSSHETPKDQKGRDAGFRFHPKADGTAFAKIWRRKTFGARSAIAKKGKAQTCEEQRVRRR